MTAESSTTAFPATWGTPLKLMSGFFIVLFAAIVGVIYSPLGPPWAWAREMIVALPVVVALFCALFTVRGYTISGQTLGIRRLFWTTKFDLTKLVSAQPDPDALGGSIRIWGNGGLFSFSGWYRNKKLGIYRAYVTDARHAVVLRFSDKTLVLTPDDPKEFLAALPPR